MHKSHKSKFILACLTALSLGLTACGDTAPTSPAAANNNNSSNGSTANNTGNATNNAQKRTVSLTGVVVDGYMKGATAFVDRNNNGKLDTGEPSGITDANGRYTLTGLKTGDEHFPIVVSIPADAVDSDTGLAVGVASVMTTPAPGTLAGDVVISPITTMIKTKMDSTPGADKYTAANAVRAQLGVSNNNLDLFADYVAGKAAGTDAVDFDKVHKIAQVVARAVAGQVATVKAAALNVDPYTTLADVIALITNQVITQLASIETEVNKNINTWDNKTSGDSIVSTATLPVDTYSTNFSTAIQNQINVTLVASKKSEANALQAVADAEIIKQQTAALAAQAAADQATATQAKLDAQAALAQVKLLLSQAQADKYTQAQAALTAQAAQDTYAQTVVNDVYTAAAAQATQVQQAVAKNPAAYTAAQQATATQAVVVSNTQQADAYTAAQAAAIAQAKIQATLDVAVKQAAIDAASAQAKADKLAAQQTAASSAPSSPYTAVGVTTPYTAVGVTAPYTAVGVTTPYTAVGVTAPYTAVGVTAPYTAVGVTAPYTAVGVTAPYTAVGVTTPPTTVGVNPIRLSVRSQDWFKQNNPVLTSITTAIVVVDGIEYPTDTYGDVFVTGVDVGLHDVHVFADGYDWVSIYQYTANSIGNTFMLNPTYNYNLPPANTTTATTATTIQPTYYESIIIVDINTPAGFVAPAVGQMEASLVDIYGTLISSPDYQQVYVSSYDPYTGQPMYKASFYNLTVPIGTSFTGALQTSMVSCDSYGFNCTSTAFNDVQATFTTGNRVSQWGTAMVTVNLSNSVVQTAIAVTNTTSSVYVMDISISNSVLAAGSLDMYTQGTSAAVIFSTTDAYGNVMDYSGSISTSTVAASTVIDLYTGQQVFSSPATVGNATATLYFRNVPPLSTLAGNLYVVETTNSSEISNFIDLGATTITTTQTPYVKVWNKRPASATINAAFSITPVFPTAANANSTSSDANLLVSITNSIYNDPNTVVNNNNNGSANMNLSFISIDAYGNAQTYWGSVQTRRSTTYDAYGAATTTIDAGTALASINFWDKPVGSIITGVLTVSEAWYDYTTGVQTTVQYVDLGMHTFTTSTQQGTSWKAGYTIPAQAVLSTPVTVTFPIVPPTSTTVLTLQSVTPPLGMVVDNVWVNDSYGYSDNLWNGQGATGITLPHTFSSLTTPKGLLQVNASASLNTYGNIGWSMSQNNLAIGSVVNLTSAFTTMPSIDPYNTGAGVITYNFGGVNTLANVGYISLNNRATGMMWNMFTPPSKSSITLPNVPAGITNPWVKGTQYDLEYEMDVLGSFTYNSFFNVYFSDQGGWQTVMQISNDEYMYDYTGIPYTY